jgi:hypothetical protein
MFSKVNKGLKDLETTIEVEMSAQIEYLGIPLGNDYSYVLYVDLTPNQFF